MTSVRLELIGGPCDGLLREIDPDEMTDTVEMVEVRKHMYGVLDKSRPNKKKEQARVFSKTAVYKFNSIRRDELGGVACYNFQEYVQ